MRRVVVVLCSILIALVGVLSTGTAAWAAAPPVALDSLTIPSAAPGQNIAATTRVHSTSGNVAVQAITVAVRSSNGAAFDFPSATAATITPSGYTFTSGTRSFPAGTYTAFTAIQVDGQWTNLTPSKTFTVAAPSVVLDSLTLPSCAAAGQTLGASTRVRASSGSVAVQAVTVAVRGSDGAAYDFPGATAATVPSTGYMFTSGTRSFAAGTYQAFTAVQVNGQWTNLSPAGSFTVSASTNPTTFCQQFNGTSSTTDPANASSMGDVRATSRTWFTDRCWSDPQRACTGSLAQYLDNHVALDGRGSLVLTADRNPESGAMCMPIKCQYASARLTMVDWPNGGVPTFSQAGGHFEARIKAPLGRGLWPAFWTIGNQATAPGWPRSGEIDILEAVGQRPFVAEQHLHGGDANATNDVHYRFNDDYTFPGGKRISDWHVYSVDWNAGSNGYIKWSIDGVLVASMTAADAQGAWTSFQGKHSVIMNLAVGGDITPNEPPDSTTPFPAKMYIDYVRVNKSPMK